MKRLIFQKQMTRRSALRVGAGAVAALGAAQVSGAAEAGGGVTFIAVNDLHFLNDGCVPFFRNVVKRMRESAPGAVMCLVAGDVANDGEPAQYRAVKEIFAGLGMPVLPVPGNHDLWPEGDRGAYDAAFPNKVNYVVREGGWQFVALDSTQGMDVDGTRISEATLAWMDATLPKLDAKAPTVVFTHFPLAEGVTFRPLNADAVLARLGKLNLRATYSGHWHGLDEQRVGGAELITSRCCARVRGNRDGSPLKGWWVCRAGADGMLARRFVPMAAPESGGF